METRKTLVKLRIDPAKLDFKEFQIQTVFT